MDEISSHQDAERFLRGLGFTTPEPVVCRVVQNAMGITKVSWRQLWNGDKRAGVSRLCARSTVEKIRRLFENGELRPYVAYLEAEREPESKGAIFGPASDRPRNGTSEELPKIVRNPEEGEPGSDEPRRNQSPAAGKTNAAGSSPLRVETPQFLYKPLRPPEYNAVVWAVEVHLTNTSKLLPFGMRELRLAVTRGNLVHGFPHIGGKNAGMEGLVPFAESALPLTARIEAVTTSSGWARFIEFDGFPPGPVKVELLVEESDGLVHRHTVSEFFDIPKTPEPPVIWLNHL